MGKVYDSIEEGRKAFLLKAWEKEMPHVWCRVETKGNLEVHVDIGHGVMRLLDKGKIVESGWFGMLKYETSEREVIVLDKELHRLHKYIWE